MHPTIINTEELDAQIKFLQEQKSGRLAKLKAYDDKAASLRKLRKTVNAAFDEEEAALAKEFGFNSVQKVPASGENTDVSVEHAEADTVTLETDELIRMVDDTPDEVIEVLDDENDKPVPGLHGMRRSSLDNPLFNT